MLKKMIILVVILCMLIPTISSSSDSTSDETRSFTFTFEPCQLIKNSATDGVSDKISMDGLSNTNRLGKPCLPVKPISILLPQDQTIQSITVETGEKQTVARSSAIETGKPLFHISNQNEQSQKIISESNNNITQSDDETQNDVYEIIGIYTWRGYNLLHLNLYPVIYDSFSHEISYYPDLTLTVELTYTQQKDNTPCFSRDAALISRVVENPEDVSSYDKTTINTLETSQYVVITSEEFAEATAEYTFQDLIDSKINQGMTASIVTIESILENSDYGVNGTWGDNNPDNPFYQEDVSDNISLFDDTQARIRNFIRYAYTELGTEYVLLAGDADEIVEEDNILPCRKLFADEEGLPLTGTLDYEADDIPSDVYYACLDGNFNDDHDAHYGESKDFNDENDEDEADLYAEVWVGRACVDSVEEINNFVKKTLWYDQTRDDYLSEILFLGEYLGFPGVSAYGGNYKDYIQDQVSIPDKYMVHKIYDRNETWSYSWLHEHLCNTMYHFINHDGHGNHNYIFKTSGNNLRYLTNEKPFFLYSHSCLTGSFDNYNCFSGYKEEDCIAEILTCEIPNGAFACILNARYGLGSEDTLESPSGAYDESFFRQVFENNILELGRANHFAKEDHIFEIDENGMRWCFYQTNLFGDPALRINTANSAPSTPIIEGKQKVKSGENQEFYCTAIDEEGNMVYYFVDWDDGKQSSWLGPFESGDEITINHTWEKRGSYQVKVKAKDEYGKEGDWGSLSLSVPKNKSFLQLFFNGFFNLDMILRLLNFS